MALPRTAAVSGLAVTVITFPEDDFNIVGDFPATVEMTRGICGLIAGTTCGKELVKLIGTLPTVLLSVLVTANLTCVMALETAREPERNEPIPIKIKKLQFHNDKNTQYLEF